MPQGGRGPERPTRLWVIVHSTVLGHDPAYDSPFILRPRKLSTPPNFWKNKIALPRGFCLNLYQGAITLDSGFLDGEGGPLIGRVGFPTATESAVGTRSSRSRFDHPTGGAMSRRNFLASSIGGVLALTPWLPGCGETSETSSGPPAAAGIPINKGPATSGAPKKERPGGPGGGRPPGGGPAGPG